MKCKWHLCNNEVVGTIRKKYCSDKCKNKNGATDHRLKKKKEYVFYKGGKCEKCGYSKSLSALCFHHKNPNEKEFQFSKNESISKSKEDIKKELDKCMLLCANCHAEEHDVKRDRK